MITDLLPPWSLLSVFLLASFVLAVTPGPGVFYIVTRSVTQGWRSGLASVIGVAAGNFGNAVAASLGLAALFAASSLAFEIVKYAGAAYLIYLGIKAMRSKSAITAPEAIKIVPLWPIFRDGFVVALLNPKTAIFFTAFLPQFMTANATSGVALAQALLLSAMFVLIATVTDAMYALLAGAIAPRLASSKAAGDVARVTAGVSFIALGVFAALSGRRT
ncbi:MAG: LysE family translocator [Casimicrobium sp.]